MAYEDFNLDDFLNDANFLKWVKEPDEELHSFWMSWQERHPDKRQLIEEAREVVRYLNFHVTQPTYKDYLEVKHNIKAQLWEGGRLGVEESLPAEVQETPEPDIPSYSFTHYYQYIAVFVGLLLISTVFFLLLSDDQEIYQTDFGQTRTVVLPDGSKVTLNANSTLQYLRDWNTSKKREVWLKGEAFFEVRNQSINSSSQAPLPSSNFIVHTPTVNLLALGTEFNVSNRRGKVKVVLVSGKVKVEIPSKEASPLFMQPGDLVEVSRHAKTVQARRVDPSFYASWRNKKLIFNDTPLSEIIQLLEDTYGVKVELHDDSLRQKKLTGSVPSDQLSTLLTVISESFHIQVEHDKDKVLLGKSK